MSLRNNAEAPGFAAETTQGPIRSVIRWAMLFSHPENSRRYAQPRSSTRPRLKPQFDPYPMSTGRNFDEVLCVLDFCQLTARQSVATRVNRRRVRTSSSRLRFPEEAAKHKFPNGGRTVKSYLGVVAQPQN